MQKDLRSNVSGFRAMGALKGDLVLKFLLRDRNVLLSDVDVVWIKDPEPLFAPLAEADVMCSTDCTSIKADEAKEARLKEKEKIHMHKEWEAILSLVFWESLKGWSVQQFCTCHMK